MDRYIKDSIMRFYNCNEKTALEIIETFNIKTIEKMAEHISQVTSVFCKR